MKIGNETELIEFKSSTGEKKEAVDSICAILNKHCNGTLYFGVDDKGNVIGQQISDSTKKDISRIINDLLEPRIAPSIEVFSIDGKDIIKVSFYGNNRPYSSGGRYLIRIGTENRKMSNDELKRLVKNEDYSCKWETEMTNYSIEDIDDETLFDFYNSARSCGRLEMNEFDKEKLLCSLELCRDGFVNNGGYALFGKNAKIGLKLATYATDSKVTFVDLKLLNGNIYNLIGNALEYVLNHINWRAEIGKRKREEIPEIPEEALREIIVNAFAHANYMVLPEIEIGIHPNIIEFYNPGAFPEALTPLDFIDKNLPSYKRNRLILDILFRSKDVEKTGTGFQRVNELCLSEGISWNYRKEAYGFFFEFIRSNVHLNVHISENLTLQEQEVFNLIKLNDRILKEEIAKRIRKSEKTVQRIIASLISKKLIIRVGSNKTGHWEVNNN